MPTSPSQVLRHEVAEALLVGCPQPKVGIGVGQPLDATVVLKAEPPDVVLCLLQLLFSMLNVDLTPVSSDHLTLKGTVSNPSHGIVDVVAQGVVEVEERKLGGGVGTDRLVSVVGSGVYVFEISVGVVLQLPIHDGIVRPLDFDIVRLHGLPPWKRDLEIDEVGPFV